MNKKTTLHICNWTGYLISNALLGRVWGWLLSKVFNGALTDEVYANEHPKLFFLRVFGILLLGVVSAMVVITWPLTILMNLIDEKIDDIEEKEDKEWE